MLHPYKLSRNMHVTLLHVLRFLIDHIYIYSNDILKIIYIEYTNLKFVTYYRFRNKIEYICKQTRNLHLLYC